ncbi:MAG: division/cell wall cluster transcriptional repressor MraZ [Acidobacteria bacterium]|nr:division/cell wall cluster transcriptional repressor MraZ [Acidobacteriota bacterium]MBI3263147.1 division/cell wall cluster transcriptional repressor MraZ [Acidobacteriota bacterium]
MDKNGVLRGNSPAKVDSNGRLKVPNEFRRVIEQEFGRDLFVTSLYGDNVRIYPLAVWTALEKKLAQVSTTHPARVKFLDRVNFYGLVAKLDAQGRVVIHPRVRESAHMVGEVDVLGNYNYLEVWNHERFLSKLQRERFTDDDARALADFGI